MCECWIISDVSCQFTISDEIPSSQLHTAITCTFTNLHYKTLQLPVISAGLTEIYLCAYTMDLLLNEISNWNRSIDFYLYCYQYLFSITYKIYSLYIYSFTPLFSFFFLHSFLGNRKHTLSNITCSSLVVLRVIPSFTSHTTLFYFSTA